MATLSQYFEQRDTPMAGSPVGKTMARILDKYPEMTFEEARAEAGALLADAAKRRRYVAPQVLSAEEKAEAAAATKARFAQWKPGRVEEPIAIPA
jgi:hypothetical protein